MRLNVNIVFFVLLLTCVFFSMMPPIYAAECRNSHPDWFFCQKDDECIMTRDACGFPDAVQRAFLTQAENCQEKESFAINCIQVMLYERDYRVACVNGMCRAVRKKDN